MTRLTMPRLSVRQRLVDRTAQRGCDGRRLGQFFLSMYRSGRLSAAEVGKGAAASNSLDVRRLAKARPKGTLLKRGKTVENTKHCARSLLATLSADVGSDVPPVYMTPVPVWNEAAARKEAADVAFLLPHEILQCVARPGQEHVWTGIDDSQIAFGHRLQEWGARLGVDVTAAPYACIGVWGDSAPTAKKSSDSVYLLTFRCFGGVDACHHWAVRATIQPFRKPPKPYCAIRWTP